MVCKPVENHKRVEVIFFQGGTYLAKPRKGTCCGDTSVCKGNGNVCCLEHRYAVPIEGGFATYPVRCTLCGAQCCRFGSEGGGDCQHECDRKCCVPIERLPRVKPAVAEASDVLYHETRAPLKNQLASIGEKGEGAPGSAQGLVPQAQGMQRL